MNFINGILEAIGFKNKQANLAILGLDNAGKTVCYINLN